jgi:hypothetical protein
MTRRKATIKRRSHGGEYGLQQTPATAYWDGTVISERDARIMDLRRRGYKLRVIAAAMGMSVSGVSDACRRIAAGRPGRDPRDG